MGESQVDYVGKKAVKNTSEHEWQCKKKENVKETPDLITTSVDVDWGKTEINGFDRLIRIVWNAILNCCFTFS